MSGPMNGTSPRMVDMATSHGSAIRRRASLYTQYTLASQNTATKKIARFRITSQVPDLKKSFTPSKRPSLPVVVVVSAKRSPVISSQQQFADDVPRGERDSCTGQDDDRGEDVDAQSRPVLDGTWSRPAARSASRYSDPVTRTAPSFPAIDRASASASPGSCAFSVLS